ncbi:RHS repeat domain-containing protein [Fibrobacter sp. UWT3]|uniref:RHS repeat domain-containing protein n=1 Tax=Fibrobacter sp. UWT3 TaxID=1896225 RepID=UPI001C3EAB4B|nr:RHS repeat-associated core domain-containing protein [Fibrobacter sp. UWT3]
MKTVNMGNSLTISYTYHISGALKTAKVETANGGELYSEMLHYEDCGDNECELQYNGNISYMVQRIAHNNRDFVQIRDVAYYYDQLNRLTKTDDLSQDYFDDFFEYDAQGRITAQRRAHRADSAQGGEYAYYDSTNRLKSVAEGMGGTGDGRDMSVGDNFVYDCDGNLVEDRSKGLIISYDWRGMPVEFLQQEPSGGSSHATRLVMMYDGSGRRISKTLLTRASDSQGWDTTLVTHYTGIGTEIREYKPRNFVRYTDSAGVEHCVSANPDYGGNASTACPLPDTVKAVIPLPHGLGRYALQDVGQVDENGAPQAFEWYLKNHLGSTMLVYGTGFPDPLGISPDGELRAAYDYRSFGEQLDLLVFTRKVTENFTGKERDDETQLDYFGARYLDPMLGMWISVDPARQFASPYLYAGNGMNPVNIIDPEGDWGLDINVGCKGAAIAGGLINLTVRYDSENPARNKVLLTVGYGVGLDLGLPIKKLPRFRVLKAVKKAERVSGGSSGDAKDDETGWHSQIDVSLGMIPLQGSFKDGSTIPSSVGIGIGGGYYDTYTIDLGKFFSDKTESKRNEALEDQADLNNTDSDSK